MPDLCKRQHTRIMIMLQGALADVQQAAHISVVQSIRVLAFLSKNFAADKRNIMQEDLNDCKLRILTPTSLLETNSRE